jgi:hypothetical protein
MGNWISSLFGYHQGNSNTTTTTTTDHRQITSYDRAILDLKNQRDKLKQYSKKV